MPRTIVFDMGNVLVSFCHKIMCAQIADVCNVSPEHIANFLFAERLQWDLECGRLSDEDFTHRINGVFQISADINALRHAASDIFQPTPGMEGLLEQLKALNYRLVLLSNTTRAHYEFISSRWTMLNHFDARILSYEIGAMKPDPAIYNALLDVIQCEPEQAFFTDDIQDNVDAARRHGIDAEVFTDLPTLITHLQNRGVEV